MKLSTIFLGTVIIGILAGCDKVDKSHPLSTDTTSTPATVSQNDALPTILLAEIAGDRKESDVATAQYLKLAESLHNPQYARRAMQIALANDNYPNALEAVQQWVRLAPQDPGARYSLSAVALEAKKLDLALQAIQEALRLKPGWPEAIALQAQILLENKQPKNAVNYLHKHLSQNPRSTVLRAVYADMLMQLGAAQAASEQYTKLLSSEKFKAYAHLSLGKIAMLKNNIPAAIRHLKIAIKDPEQSNPAYYLLAAIAEDTQNYPTAIAFYSEIKEGPLAIRSQIRAAFLLAQHVDLTKAIDHLDTIPTFNADEYRQISIAKSTILLLMNHPREAFNALTTALGTLPMDKDLLLLQSNLGIQIGEIDLAEKNLRALLKEDPNNIEALNAISTTLIEYRHDYTAANKYLTHGLTLAPNDSTLLHSMGWLQYRLHNYPIAIEYLRRAWKIQPQVNTAAQLGIVLWHAGDHAGADQIWQEGLQKFPNNPIIINAIKEVKQ